MAQFSFGQRNLSDIEAVKNAIMAAGQGHFRNEMQRMQIQQDLAQRQGASQVLEAYKSLIQPQPTLGYDANGKPKADKEGKVPYEPVRPEQLLTAGMEAMSKAQQFGQHGDKVAKLIGETTKLGIDYAGKVLGKNPFKESMLQRDVTDASGQTVPVTVGGKQGKYVETVGATTGRSYGKTFHEFTKNATDPNVAMDARQSMKDKQEMSKLSIEKDKAWAALKASQPHLDVRNIINGGQEPPKIEVPVYDRATGQMTSTQKDNPKWIKAMEATKAWESKAKQLGIDYTPIEQVAQTQVAKRMPAATPKAINPLTESMSNTMQKAYPGIGKQMPNTSAPVKGQTKKGNSFEIQYH